MPIKLLLSGTENPKERYRLLNMPKKQEKPVRLSFASKPLPMSTLRFERLFNKEKGAFCFFRETLTLCEKSDTMESEKAV